MVCYLTRYIGWLLSEAHGDVSAETSFGRAVWGATANPLPEHLRVMLVMAPLNNAFCAVKKLQQDD
jgi:hypothetical protein